MNDRYLVLEGLDGIGKGVVLGAIKEYALEESMRVFDLHDHWKTNNRSPDPAIYRDFDLVITAEPRYAGAGADVRWWLDNKDRPITARALANLYGIDRQQHLEQIVHPALDAGAAVVQSRTWLSTCVYQPRMAQRAGEPELTIDEIASHPGNVLARSRPPTLVLIGTVPDVSVLEERFTASHRESADRFERLEFQAALKPFYEDPELLALFPKTRSYDASVSEEHSAREAVDAFRAVLDRR